MSDLGRQLPCPTVRSSLCKIDARNRNVEDKVDQYQKRVADRKNILRMFDNIVVATTVAATAYIFIFLWKKNSGSRDAGRRYPPSASVLSLLRAVFRGGIGVLPDHFMRSAEKLGPVISYNLGARQVVILDGKEAISEAFLRQSEAFADRIPFWTEANILNPKHRGIIFARYDDAFKKYHKLCLVILKEFGFGVNSVSETRILQEVESLTTKILQFNGRSSDPKSLLSVSTFSVVSNILWGETFMKSDTCHKICDAVNVYNRNLGLAVDSAPLLRFIPMFRRRLQALEQSQKDMFLGIEKGIETSRSVECETTFVGRFIEIQGPDYDRQDLLYILRDLCLASSDTVSATLLWALVELANHSEIQSRLQGEIDDIIPKERFPSLDDKPRMPYTEAVILEVMRRHTFVPLYVPHATLKDAEVLGFAIPKGSLVLANAFSVHMNPKFWKDPESFRPERFLDANQKITGSEYVIPFGIGKRSCLGEILGRQQVFLYLTSLIQHFNIRPPIDQDSITVKEVIGLAVFPSDFEVRFIPRISIPGTQK